MKKIYLPLLLLGCFHPTKGQKAPDIVRHYQDAIRSTAQLQTLQSIYATGEFHMKQIGFPAVIYFKEPELTRIEMEFQKLKFIMVLNDSVKWSYNPIDKSNTIEPVGPSDKSMGEGSQTMDYISYDLIGYPENHVKLNYSGKTKLDSLEVFIVEQKLEGANRTFYINTKTFLINKIVDSKGLRFFAEYKKQDSIVFPYFLQVEGSNDSFTVNFEHVEFNIHLPDDLFVIPPEAYANRNSKEGTDFDKASAFDTAGEADSALYYYNHAIINQPSYVAYNQRGLLKMNRHQYYDAITDFNRALELNSTGAAALNNRGLAKYYLKDDQAAITDFNDAIRLDSSLAEAYQNRGLSYSRQKDYQKALDDFTKSVKRNPALLVNYMNRGIMLAQLNQLENALTAYHEAEGAGYKDPDLFNYKGVANYRLGNYDSAALNFRKASNGSDDLQYLENYARTLYALQRYDEAIDAFSKYLKRSPDSDSILNLIGLCYFDKEIYDVARTYFDQAITSNPKEAIYYNNRADTRNAVQDYTGALSDYDTSLKLYPTNPSVFYRRGLLKIYLGKKIEGCTDLTTANDLDYEPAKDAIMKNCP